MQQNSAVSEYLSNCSLLLNNKQQYGLKNVSTVPDVDTITRAYSLIKQSSKCMSTRDYKILTKAVEFIEANYKNSQLRVTDIANSLCVTDRTLLHKMKRYTGLTPSAVLMKYRLEKVIAMIVSNNDGIAEIAYSAGFSNISAFHRMFKKHYGMTPKEYRSQYRYH